MLAKFIVIMHKIFFWVIERMLKKVSITSFSLNMWVFNKTLKVLIKQKKMTEDDSNT
jgi:hypothetical protein